MRIGLYPGTFDPVTNADNVNALGAGECSDNVDLNTELLELVEPEFGTQPIGQQLSLLIIGAGHHDDRLGRSEPQV